METRISGIPCNIKLIGIYGTYVPAKTNADPNSCYEAEYPEVEFQVLDRRGRRAPWLEAKMTDADRERIEDMLLRH